MIDPKPPVVANPTPCFVCGNPAIALASALNPGGPVCYMHSWGKTEQEALAQFRAAVKEISRSLR